MKMAAKKTFSILLIAFAVFTTALLSGFAGLDLSSFGEFFTTKVEAATEYTSGYYTYTLDNNNDASIIGFDTTVSGDITIPQTIDGYAVTEIAKEAFYSCAVSSVIIPEGVTSIGVSAFEKCSSLTNVIIPDSVKSIGGGAFRRCSSLKNVIIPNGVTGMYGFTFSGCLSLESVSIPDSVTIIGPSEFSGCASLKSISIPDSVTSIDGLAFIACTSLESITLPDNLTKVYSSAFEDTAIYNDESNWDNGCFYVDSCLVEARGLISGECTIREGTTSITDHAFYECISLKSVTIPDSVMVIGDSAFEGCSSLTSATIPDNVTKIGTSAFKYCSELKTVVLGKGITRISKELFYYCKNLTTINLENIEFVCEDAFYCCGSLANIKFGNKLRYVDRYAFCHCDSLENIYIPGKVYEIERSSFRGDNLKSFTVDPANKYYSNDEYGVLFNKDKTQLIQYPEGNERTSYSIPDGVACISEYAFSYCDYIVSISIPNSVENIYGDAFVGCDSLADVYYNGSENEWNSITINSSNSCLADATIHFMKTEESTTSPSESATEVTPPDESTTNSSESSTTKPSKPTTRPEESTTKPESSSEPENISVNISKPSTDTIGYGDSIILHAKLTSQMLDGYYIEWTVDNDSFTIVEISENGETCAVTPSVSGDAVFTATVYDVGGNVVSSDEQTLTSKAGFFQKILAFFKKLFGLTKVYDE